MTLVNGLTVCRKPASLTQKSAHTTPNSQGVVHHKCYKQLQDDVFLYSCISTHRLYTCNSYLIRLGAWTIGSSQNACLDHALRAQSSPPLKEWNPVQASTKSNAFVLAGSPRKRRCLASAGVMRPCSMVSHVSPVIK